MAPKKGMDVKHCSSVNTLLALQAAVAGSGPTSSQEVEMSGGITDDDDFEPTFLNRRVDTEGGGRTMTFSTGHNEPNVGLQRRSTLPQLQ